MVFFDRYGPCIVTLDVILSFFRWSPSRFYLFSVSGQYGPNYRRVLEEKVKRCERQSTNSIGAIQPQLILLAPHGIRRLKAKRGTLAAPIGEAWQICSASKKFLCLCLFSLHFAYWQSMNRRANSIGAAKGKQKNRPSADAYSLCFAYCYRNRLLILMH